jgi:hypothetical protein
VKRTLDYATPDEPRPEPYWLLFFVAWIVSLPVAHFLDDAIYAYQTGRRSADGGVTMLSLVAIIPAIWITALAPKRRWVAAVIGGACSPLAVGGMYFLWP